MKYYIQFKIMHVNASSHVAVCYRHVLWHNASNVSK